jgi:hypothetical protein
MEDKFRELMSSCYDIEFGPVNISDREKEFCMDLNNEIISLCKSLPESTQTDALLFLMRYLRTSFDGNPDFFACFYAPAWSIVYWLIESGRDDKGLEQRDIENAKSAHSMAMFLHSLDDHLSDGELPTTHLSLLLRSQSWMVMNHALHSFADGIDRGEQIVRGFIDDYYSSICCLKEIDSLDSYCDLFRKQMATWLIVPVLMTKKMTSNEEFTRAIHTAYGSFGIAWRLLDDIKDMEIDMMKGTHSSIYVCLSKDTKNWWDKDAGEKADRNSDYTKGILDYVLENCVIDRIKERICSELESAASIADRYNMTGLADEFRCLLRPLRNRQEPL